MTLVHRARLWALNRKANALLRRYNRPHQQSEHMTGRALPPSHEISGRFALMTAVAVVAVVLALNRFPEDPAPAQCAQVVAQK
jgi:hypothetical protein